MWSSIVFITLCCWETAKCFFHQYNTFFLNLIFTNKCFITCEYNILKVKLCFPYSHPTICVYVDLAMKNPCQVPLTNKFGLKFVISPKPWREKGWYTAVVKISKKYSYIFLNVLIYKQHYRLLEPSKFGGLLLHWFFNIWNW